MSSLSLTPTPNSSIALGSQWKDKVVTDLHDVTRFPNTITQLCLSYLSPFAVSSSVKVDEELHFTVQDMQVLCMADFGLRHVTGQELLENECLDGMNYGCSLNLSPYRLKRAIGEGSALIGVFENSVHGGIDRFEKGVDAFIDNCLSYDIRATSSGLVLDRSTGADFLKVLDVTRFMIVKYPMYILPADYNAWGDGLGRFPKANAGASDVMPLPVLECSNCCEKEEMEKALSRAQFDEIEKRVVSKTRTLIIQKLRAETSGFFKGNEGDDIKASREQFVTDVLKLEVPKAEQPSFFSRCTIL